MRAIRLQRRIVAAARDERGALSCSDLQCTLTDLFPAWTAQRPTLHWPVGNKAGRWRIWPVLCKDPLQRWEPQSLWVRYRLERPEREI